jgi:hypothetical protein
MPNAWITHVKKYASDNNKSYGCSISDPACTASYTKVVKISKKQKREERNKYYYDQFKYDMIDRIKKIKEDSEKPIIRMKFNMLNKDIKEDIKNNYSKYYEKLFNKN